MKLYLIRHGQTLWNSEGKIQGKTDIPLNETGLLQAELLAEAMERYPVTAVYASPLKRAYQTAECVAGRQGLSVIAEEGLREVDFGFWEGMTWSEIEERYPEDFALWDKIRQSMLLQEGSGGRTVRPAYPKPWSGSSGRPGEMSPW